MHTTGYSTILRERNCVCPLVATLIGRVPESMLAVTFVLVVRQGTGSYVAAGLAAGGYAAGAAVGGPVAGRALDHATERAVLLPRALTFAAALVALVAVASHGSPVVMILLATMAGVSRPPLESAMRARWAAIVPADRLQAAYSLDAVGQDLIWLGGPLVLSGLLLFGDARLALIVCAGCALLGTSGYVVSLGRETGARLDRHVAGRVDLHSPALRAALAAAALYGVAMGAFEIALTAFCSRHGDRAAVGALLAIWSVGSLVGGLAYGTRAWRASAAARISLLLLALGVLLAALELAHSALSLGAMLFVMGLPTAPFTGTLSNVVGDLAPHQRRNEAFTWMTAMVTSGIALGNAVAGPAIQLDSLLGFPLAATASVIGSMLAMRSRGSAAPRSLAGV
jgi:MFS family permease